MNEPTGKKSATPSCPLCGKPVAAEFKPFCSRRCADVDLNRWLSGVYKVPVVEADDEVGERPPPKPANDAP